MPRVAQHQTNRMIGNVRRAVIRHVTGNDAALARFLDIDNVMRQRPCDDNARVFCGQHIPLQGVRPQTISPSVASQTSFGISLCIRLVYPDFRTVAYNRLFVFRRAIEPRVRHKHQRF